eukprot:CAMPEP_0172372236 /NCGR_PEP_ID=MMETSP1060-20121228/46616_1 /TAXON_ID=37318 /ORGANISM="Pseudo-nitzschia pungens, Strain cf. cingulata" /LENGTH=984 /DNA_ID=CAMNT_0013098141 /DNA_START=655 /DNA_END=3609 /DNA_ORIENTATION=-
MAETSTPTVPSKGVSDSIPMTTTQDVEAQPDNNTSRRGTTMNMDAQLRPELKDKIQNWILSFYHLDPRYKILTFFNLVASEGADNVTDDQMDEELSYVPSTEKPPNNTGLNDGMGFSDNAKSIQGKSTLNNSNPSRTSNARENYKINAHLMSRPSARNIRPSTLSLLSRIFNATSILTVWRPCSNDAMRKMMEGTGVGKGLDIKGKSAKKGILSAYVPFMQIFENEQKKEIQPITVGAEMRIYYKDEKLRDYVMSVLQKFLDEGPPQKRKKKKKKPMSRKDKNQGEAIDACEEKNDYCKENPVDSESIDKAPKDDKIDNPDDLTGSPSDTNDDDCEDEEEEEWDSVDSDRVPDHKNPNSPRYVPTKLKKLKKFAKVGYFGIECSQRLFWYATIEDADISRKGTGTETGRPSLPGFQDGNLKTLKVAQSQVPKPKPMPVVLQHKSLEDVQKDNEARNNNGDNDDEGHPLDGSLDPRFLVLAYEEQGTIKPVVSDFDGFLLGWRREALWFGCNLPRYQEELMMWCVDRIEEILDDQKENPTNRDTWTQRWLDVLKKSAAEGFHIDTPEYGFGDPKSTSIMEHAAKKLISTGAVRHGCECFNYRFPQELDDMFLLISDTLKPVPWKYVNEKDLQAILSQKIAEGFMFPLNPKWILSDIGWKKIYDDLMKSDALYADLSKDVWYPPYNGIRQKIEDIHKRHPNGFQRCTDPVKTSKDKGYEKLKSHSPNGRRQSATNILRDTLDEGLGSELTGNAFADLADMEFDDFVGRTSAMPGRGLNIDHEMGRNILKARESLTIEELEDDYADLEPTPRKGENSSATRSSLIAITESKSGNKKVGVTWSKQPKSPNRRPSNQSHSSSLASSAGSTVTSQAVSNTPNSRSVGFAEPPGASKNGRRKLNLKKMKLKRKSTRSTEANSDPTEHDITETNRGRAQVSTEVTKQHKRTGSGTSNSPVRNNKKATANSKTTTSRSTIKENKRFFSKLFKK